MPIILKRDTNSAVENIDFELKNEEGQVSLGSDISSGSIPIKFWDGEAWVTYNKSGNPVVLDTNTNLLLVDGPARFRVEKPINVSLVIYVGTDTNFTLL